MARVIERVRNPAENRIVDALRSQVLKDGRPGVALPTVRELVAAHKASAATVHRALAVLVREGVIVAKPGRGTFVAEPASPRRAVDDRWQSLTLGDAPPGGDALRSLVDEAPASLLSLVNGYSDLALTSSVLSAAAARAARRADAWTKTPLEGDLALREWFARGANANLEARDILIASGGQAALAIAFRALAKPGDCIVLESPTYLGAIALARAMGLRILPVPTDEGGLDPEFLERALEQSGARLVYLQPSFANPTGRSIPRDRHSAILAVLARFNAFAVEDDYARDLTLEGDEPPPLLASADGHVVYLRSLTKSTSPLLRVAAIAARGPVLARLRAVRALEDLWIAPLLQHTAFDVVTSGSWRRHLRAMRVELKTRRDAAVRAVRAHLGEAALAEVPMGGLGMWVRLPATVDDVSVIAKAREAGVAVGAGTPWFPGEASGPHVRISYAAAGAAALTRGIEILGYVVQRAAR